MSSKHVPALLRHAPATVQGRYVVRAPGAGAAAHHFIGFHGQGQTAEEMLAAFADSVPGDDWLVVSVQGLNTHYAGRNQAVVASWMTTLDRDRAIATNVAYVDTVVDQVVQEFGAPSTRVFAGFSQGVGMAHRAAVLGRHSSSAIITVGGDVPPELRSLPARPGQTVLAMTGENDAYFNPAALEIEVQGMRRRGIDAQLAIFGGGHEWNAATSTATAVFLRGLTAPRG